MRHAGQVVTRDQIGDSLARVLTERVGDVAPAGKTHDAGDELVDVAGGTEHSTLI
jgi:hypothetical protein